MADQRALDAIRRIERAVARIEAAANRSQEYDRLREAHAALRQRVAGAIGEIDRLLETEGTS